MSKYRKRRTLAKKAETVSYYLENGLAKSSVKYDVSAEIIYKWRKSLNEDSEDLHVDREKA